MEKKDGECRGLRTTIKKGIAITILTKRKPPPILST
jgi:hypothetical protein